MAALIEISSVNALGKKRFCVANNTIIVAHYYSFIISRYVYLVKFKLLVSGGKE